jgi:type II secretion system protein N
VLHRNYPYIVKVGGYLLFTLLVLGLMLWVLFPEEAVRKWINASMQARVPQLELRTKKVRLTYPLGLRMQPVLIGVRKGNEVVPFQAEFCTIRPKLWAWLTGGKPVAIVKGRILQGDFSAQVRLDDQGGVRIERGRIDNMQLSDQALTQYLNRMMKGSLSGSFSGSLFDAQDDSQPLTAILQVRSMHLDLQESVLGHESFDLDSVALTLSSTGDAAVIQGGQVESRLFTGSFQGGVNWSVTGRSNQVSINGSLDPRPELFANLGDTEEVQGMIKEALNSEPLPFEISGTLQRPGISFGSFSELLQSVTQEPRG